MSTEHNFDRGLGAGNDKLQLVGDGDVDKDNINKCVEYYDYH